MTDDPLSQAGQIVGQAALDRGREIAREQFIEPTMANGGDITSTIMFQLNLTKVMQDGPDMLIGMVICMTEVAAGILRDQREGTRSLVAAEVRERVLVAKLEAAERTIRNLTAQAIPQWTDDPDGS